MSRSFSCFCKHKASQATWNKQGMLCFLMGRYLVVLMATNIAVEVRSLQNVLPLSCEPFFRQTAFQNPAFDWILLLHVITQ